MRVLFVCTGNICRSPVAERYARAWAASHGVEMEAASAGTRAVVGHPVERNAAAALLRLGGDPAGFAARRLAAEHVRGADLVLTMTKSHRESVLHLAPTALRRVFTLAEADQLAADPLVRGTADLAAARARIPAAVDAPDIVDPIGGGPDVHDHVADRIAAHVSSLLASLSS